MRFILSISIIHLLAANLIAAEKLERHYLPTYEESRTAFRKLSDWAGAAFAKVEVDKAVVPSKVDKDLTVDTLFIPAQKNPKGLVVIVSGVHGAEAFAASAVQRMLLEDVLLARKTDVSETGYLFIHALNPYGFKYWRRVSENNVDLNRNFSVDKKHFSKKNEVYDRLNGILNPEKKASASWTSHAVFLAKTLSQLLHLSQDEMNQGILGGQWKHEKGIYFGGLDFEPQNAIAEKLLTQYSVGYDKVLVLDFHTGYGKRGYMHLLPNPPDTNEIAERWKTVFGDYRIESTEGEDFYSNEGDFSTFASRLLEKQKKKTVPMLIEYGTMDSHNLKGAIASLSRSILENQLHHHGARNERSKQVIRHNFQEMFYPSGADWRTEVMKQTREHVPVFVDRFHRLLN